MLEWVAYALLAGLGVYAAARLISAAYFMSRRDYERKTENGRTKPHP